MPGIVIIEDDALMRSLLLEWLVADGYRVTAPDTSAAGPAPADLVIVDVYMPRDGGFERVRRAHNAYPRTPIIAISGQFCRGLPGAGATAEALGVDRVIAKPFDRQALLDAVRYVIGPARETAQDA